MNLLLLNGFTDRYQAKLKLFFGYCVKLWWTISSWVFHIARRIFPVEVTISALHLEWLFTVSTYCLSHLLYMFQVLVTSLLEPNPNSRLIRPSTKLVAGRWDSTQVFLWDHEGAFIEIYRIGLVLNLVINDTHLWSSHVKYSNTKCSWMTWMSTFIVVVWVCRLCWILVL